MTVITRSETRLAYRRRALLLTGQYGPLISLVVLCAVLTLVNERFLTLQNITNILRQASIMGVVAFGMTTVLIVGGIDLSAGNVISLAGLLGFSMIAKGYGTGAAIAMGLVSGLALGCVNALLIILLGISPLVVTVGTSFVFRSIDLVFTNGGSPVYAPDVPEPFRLLFHGFLGPVPNPIVILAVVFVAFYLLMHRMRFGRAFYATGSQVEVARLSGIRARLFIALPYMDRSPERHPSRRRKAMVIGAIIAVMLFGLSAMGYVEHFVKTKP